MDRTTLKLPAFLRKAVSLCVIVTFCVQTVLPAYAQTVLPQAGVRVDLSPAFDPAVLRGLKVYTDNPFKFDFIVDAGDSGLGETALKDESTRLIKYFLASLTTPEDDLWVNLSPYEQDRIIPDSFGTTEMGRDLLAQDYILKQITASIIYPENELGKKFWDKVYKQAYEQYGTTDIPVNTFNKVWVVPDKAVVYEHEHTAVVTQTHLNVMLEQDYLSLMKNVHNDELGTSQVGGQDVEKLSEVSSKVVREIIIPELEKEVNQGKNFAQLRQVYNSLILAAWYKKKLKDSILAKIYIDKKKTVGVDLAGEPDPLNVQKIYNQYLEAFKTGVYNYIKEDYDVATKTVIPRKYVSGGVKFGAIDNAMLVTTDRSTLDQFNAAADAGKLSVVTAGLETPKLEHPSDQAMLADVYDAQKVAADTRSPLDIFMSVSSPEYAEGQQAVKDLLAAGYSREKLMKELATAFDYDMFHTKREVLKQEVTKYISDDAFRIFEKLASFSERAYSDKAYSHDARMMLWKFGEISFAEFYRTNYFDFNEDFPGHDRMLSTPRLKELPILDVAGGPAAATYFPQLKDEKVEIIDADYFVEGYLNAAAKRFNKTNNVKIIRQDVNLLDNGRERQSIEDFNGVLKSGSYRHVRLGNIWNYVKQIRSEFFVSLLNHMADGGTISVESKETRLGHLAESYYAFMFRGSIADGRSGVWTDKIGEGRHLDGANVRYDLFTKFGIDTLTDSVKNLANRSAVSVNITWPKNDGELPQLHLITEEGGQLQARKLSNVYGKVFDQFIPASLRPKNQASSVLVFEKQSSFEDIRRTIDGFKNRLGAATIARHIASLKADPVELKIGRTTDGAAKLSLRFDEGDKVKTQSVSKNFADMLLAILPAGDLPAQGESKTISFSGEQKKVVAVETRLTGKALPQGQTASLNSLSDDEFSKAKNQIDRLAVLSQAEGSMFAVLQSVWDDVQLKDKVTGLSQVVRMPQGDVLGFVLAYPTDPTSASIEKFGVSAEARRNGIGTQVLNALAKRADAVGIKTMTLAVLKTNTVAQTAYEALGFKNLTPTEARDDSRYNAFGYSVETAELLRRTQERLNEDQAMLTNIKEEAAVTEGLEQKQYPVEVDNAMLTPLQENVYQWLRNKTLDDPKARVAVNEAVAQEFERNGGPLTEKDLSDMLINEFGLKPYIDEQGTSQFNKETGEGLLTAFSPDVALEYASRRPLNRLSDEAMLTDTDRKIFEWLKIKTLDNPDARVDVNQYTASQFEKPSGRPYTARELAAVLTGKFGLKPADQFDPATGEGFLTSFVPVRAMTLAAQSPANIFADLKMTDEERQDVEHKKEMLLSALEHLKLRFDAMRITNITDLKDLTDTMAPATKAIKGEHYSELAGQTPSEVLTDYTLKEDLRYPAGVFLDLGLYFLENLHAEGHSEMGKLFGKKEVTDALQDFLDEWNKANPGKSPHMDVPLLLHLALAAFTDKVGQLEALSGAYDNIEDQNVRDRMKALDAIMMSFHVNSGFAPAGLDAPDLVSINYQIRYLTARLKSQVPDGQRKVLSRALAAILVALAKKQSVLEGLLATNPALVESGKALEEFGLANIRKVIDQLMEEDSNAEFPLSIQAFEYNLRFWEFKTAAGVRPSDLLLDFDSERTQGTLIRPTAAETRPEKNGFFEPRKDGLYPAAKAKEFYAWWLGRAERMVKKVDELDGKISVNQTTGRLRLETEAVVKLNFELWGVAPGQTAANLTEGMFQGSTDDDINQLTAVGQQQAQEAAQQLFDKFKDKIKAGEVIVVVTSQLGRSKGTAAAFIKLVEDAGGKVELADEEIRAGANEINFGAWSNKTPADLPAQTEPIRRYREGFDATVRPRNGESYLDLVLRAKPWLQKLNERYPGRTVVLFGHPTQMAAIGTLTGDGTQTDESGYINWQKNPAGNATPVSLNPSDEAMLAREIKIRDVLDKIGNELEPKYVSEMGQLMSTNEPRLVMRTLLKIYRTTEDENAKTHILNMLEAGFAYENLKFYKNRDFYVRDEELKNAVVLLLDDMLKPGEGLETAAMRSTKLFSSFGNFYWADFILAERLSRNNPTENEEFMRSLFRSQARDLTKLHSFIGHESGGQAFAEEWNEFLVKVPFNVRDKNLDVPAMLNILSDARVARAGGSVQARVLILLGKELRDEEVTDEEGSNAYAAYLKILMEGPSAGQLTALMQQAFETGPEGLKAARRLFWLVQFGWDNAQQMYVKLPDDLRKNVEDQWRQSNEAIELRYILPPISEESDADEAMLSKKKRQQVLNTLSILQSSAGILKAEVEKQNITQTFQRLEAWVGRNKGQSDIRLLRESAAEWTSLMELTGTLADQMQSVANIAQQEMDKAKGRPMVLFEGGRPVLIDEKEVFYDIVDKINKAAGLIGLNRSSLETIQEGPNRKEDQRAVARAQAMLNAQERFMHYVQMLNDILAPNSIDRKLDRKDFGSQGRPEIIYKNFLIPALDILASDEAMLTGDGKGKISRATDEDTDVYLRQVSERGMAAQGYKAQLRPRHLQAWLSFYKDDLPKIKEEHADIREMSDEDIFTKIFLDMIIEDEKEIMRNARLPSEEQTKDIRKALLVLEDQLRKWGGNADLLSTRVLVVDSFPDDKEESHTLGQYLGFNNVLVLRSDLTGEKLYSVLIHEMWHRLSRGLADVWIDEGITEYLTVKTMMNAGIIAEESPITGGVDNKELEHLLAYQAIGPVSKHIIKEAMDNSLRIFPDVKNGTFTQRLSYPLFVIVTEYIVERILPKLDVSFSEFLKAYREGQPYGVFTRQEVAGALKDMMETVKGNDMLELWGIMLGSAVKGLNMLADHKERMAKMENFAAETLSFMDIVSDIFKRHLALVKEAYDKAETAGEDSIKSELDQLEQQLDEELKNAEKLHDLRVENFNSSAAIDVSGQSTDEAMLTIDKNIDLIKSNGVVSIQELGSAIKKAESLNAADHENVIGSTLFEPDSSLTAISPDRFSDGKMSQHVKLQYILQEKTHSDGGMIKFTITFDKTSRMPNRLVVLIGKESGNDPLMLKEQKATLNAVYAALKEVYPDQVGQMVLQNTANVRKLIESSGLAEGSMAAGQGEVFLSKLMDALQEVGGINLNPANLNLEVRNDGGEIKFDFDPAQVENLKVDGFIPVILNVQPVKDLPLLLGIKEEEMAPTQLTQASP
jgi:broad specificity phosphatase PhoE/ribosomal protein S18 acetylase RimI-like enzyme